jgi:hypothetical protein
MLYSNNGLQALPATRPVSACLVSECDALRQAN